MAFLPTTSKLANSNTIVNTPQESWWLISTVTTEDWFITTIWWPTSWPWSRTQITLAYNSEFKSITMTQFDGIKEKSKIHLYSQKSILELKRFLNEMTVLDLENLWKWKLVYSNASISDTDMSEYIKNWYNSDPIKCKDLLTQLIGWGDMIQGRDIWTLVDRKIQVEMFRKIVTDDKDIFKDLATKYKKIQHEKLIEEFLKDNSWILGLSLDSVQYNNIDDSLNDLKKIQEQIPWRPEHNFDILTETSVVNLVELKLPTEQLFNIWEDGHGNPKWNPKFFEHVTQIQNYKRVLEQVWDSWIVPQWKKIIFPNTWLIIGRKSDMNDQQLKVFDMYRKNIVEPKIYTYDELLERAEKIINILPKKVIEAAVLIEDIPF